MKIHTEPVVALVGRPQLVSDGVMTVLEWYGLGSSGWQRGEGDKDGDGLSELMGRLCYGSFGKAQGRVGAEAYMANILSSGHGSVLEHGSWSFVVLGASRGYLAQQTRHRAGFAYSAESSHFIHYSEDGEARGEAEAAVCLTGLSGGDLDDAAAIARAAVRGYEGLWSSLRASFPVDAKVKKLVSGAARGLLPIALECKLGFSANARALRHMVEMRGNAENTLEIRLVAAQVARIMIKEAPASFQDVGVGRGEDGWPVVTSHHRKV